MLKVPNVINASAITGDKVTNPQGEDLGRIEDLMVDTESGRIAYAILSFGGFLGLGNKLFAVPWSALTIHQEERRFILDVPRERLENAPGFDREEWPDMADTTWGSAIYSYYGISPYWL